MKNGFFSFNSPLFGFYVFRLKKMWILVIWKTRTEMFHFWADAESFQHQIKYIKMIDLGIYYVYGFLVSVMKIHEAPDLKRTVIIIKYIFPLKSCVNIKFWSVFLGYVCLCFLSSKSRTFDFRLSFLQWDDFSLFPKKTIIQLLSCVVKTIHFIEHRFDQFCSKWLAFDSV